MEFGVPTQRQTKEEKYPDIAVLTMSKYQGKGTARSFMLNAKAVETMNLPKEGATVAFSFDGGTFIANGNQTQIPDHYKVRVSKGEPRKVSDKRTYEYVAKLMKLNTNEENEFLLEQETHDGLIVFKFSPMPEVKETTGTDEVASISPMTGGEDENDSISNLTESEKREDFDLSEEENNDDLEAAQLQEAESVTNELIN